MIYKILNVSFVSFIALLLIVSYFRFIKGINKLNIIFVFVIIGLIVICYYRFIKCGNNLVCIYNLDEFKASFTPEIYVLNGDFEQLYHGRIDDSRREKNVKVSDLRNTLDEVLAGKKVSVSETKAFGCTIKRVKKK